MVVSLFQGNRHSMYIVLPNEVNGLAALEDKIGEIGIANVLKHVNPSKVDVSLPKFEITHTIDLNKILISVSGEFFGLSLNNL